MPRVKYYNPTTGAWEYADMAFNAGAGESVTVPSYWQSHLAEKVALIRQAVLTAGFNKSAFFFYTDSHWSNDTTYTAKMAPALLKYLYKNAPIRKTNYGGDIVSAEAADAETMAYLWDWRSQLYGLDNHHSVPGNHDDGNATNNLFSAHYVYGYLLAPEETADIVRGDADMYYYIDNPAEKTRYLYLDTAYQGVTDAEQEFVKAALLSTPESWHIVAIAHAWYANIYNDDGTVTLDGFDTGAKLLLDMFDQCNARTGDFAECAGWVEFCIGGHYHLDHVEHTDGGIPVIVVEADCLHNRGGTIPSAGTTDEAAISAVIADYSTKTVQIIRIGRGDDYEVTINVSKISYTNVLSSAILSTGEVLNGTGWAANSRLGSSPLDSYVGNGSHYITGHIPIDSSIDSTIRLRNITYDSTTHNNYAYVFAVYNASFTRVGFIYTTDITETNGYAPVIEDGNIVQFTVRPNHFEANSWTDGVYFAICCTYIGDDAIITINEEIE